MSDLTDIQAICATALVLVSTVCLTLTAIFAKPTTHRRRTFEPPTWTTARHQQLADEARQRRERVLAVVAAAHAFRKSHRIADPDLLRPQIDALIHAVDQLDAIDTEDRP